MDTKGPLVKRLTLLAAIAAALAGCGEKKETTTTAGTEPLTVMLDFFPNADHAGLYAAQARGDYKRAGLQVKLQPPNDPSEPLRLLAAGRVDLAISYEPELLLARDKGLTLASVGAIVQRPLTSIISLKNVAKPGDLQGKRVGTAGIPYQSAYLKTIEKAAGVTGVKEVNVGFNLVPAMLSKKVDATLGGFWNYEGIQLERRHKHPKIIRVDQAGVPTYDELVVVAREDTLRTRDGAAKVRRFMQATAAGYNAVRADPNAGVDPLVAASKDLDRGLQLASVKATLPAFFPPAGKPFGWQDLNAWGRYAKWMSDNNLLKRLPAVGRAVTNDYLPGQGIG
jgi:putative hydroxymethylpyrimidine transport system substrate-binding protein